MKKQDRENIIAGLINLGCTRTYEGDDYNWSYDRYTFRLRESDRLVDVFRILMKASETLKVWEIKRTLQIVDPNY
jgi:hypothetical protein